MVAIFKRINCVLRMDLLVEEIRSRLLRFMLSPNAKSENQLDIE